ncbi:DUF4062 domain-containing protein [Flavobacterium sp. 20NA77.7]|uniref:DUF4062 domain-containing protein n=1 Tax=Flavobacterium nakdongensis TaxID=3073563 RepID=A0ABY9R6Q3_9FLAO|nr:DUF4062 domain-containing protein [Flavobacterium sp. 20NA77.7]WMW76922.1 DUF4062 domain-containing protein [Flavobacterium sp. 20NA77.7]
MASLRVFVSSTCFDLGPIRGQLRNFLTSMGYEPIMSDYNDVLYDPRIHTHTSCIEEIATCDIIILLVGSRFGGKAIPEAISKVDFDALLEKSKSVEHLKKKENISVTQLEVLKAVEIEIPIFTFIDSRLWNDHELYEKNKNKSILKDIEFPSIEKPETAEFIFEFINFLRHRTRGNSINTFSKFEDIDEALKKQWAGLFQKLLNESRNKQLEFKRIDLLSNQFEDLKTAILTSIGSTNERDVARGVVRFRRLVDFLRNMRLPDYSSILNTTISWADFMQDIVGINSVIDLDSIVPNLNRHLRFRTLLVKNDNTFYEVRFGSEYIDELSQEFEAFNSLPSETKNIIFDALADMRNGLMIIRYHREDYREYMNRFQQEYMLNRQLFDNDNEESES